MFVCLDVPMPLILLFFHAVSNNDNNDWNLSVFAFTALIGVIYFYNMLFHSKHDIKLNYIED